MLKKKNLKKKKGRVESRLFMWGGGGLVGFNQKQEENVAFSFLLFVASLVSREEVKKKM